MFNSENKILLAKRLNHEKKNSFSAEILNLFVCLLDLFG